MTIQEYITALRQHDWYYNYSDSGEVYQRGYHQAQMLSHIAKTQGGEFKQEYDKAVALYL